VRPALYRDSAAALAQSVRNHVDFLIANCRLAPDADATLHIVIARLLNAAAALQEDPASPAGLPQVQQTLHPYPPYFAHPGWREADGISRNSAPTVAGRSGIACATGRDCVYELQLR
jgi:hypothetical protein